MKQIPGILKVVQNKYLIASISFVVWILFFDRNDLFTQWDRKQELNKLEESKAYYQAEIKSISKGLSDIQNNPAIIEKYARENFYLKRPNEDIFIIEEQADVKNWACPQYSYCNTVFHL